MCYVCEKLHEMPLWKRNMECDVEITLTEIETVLSTLCIISYHRMLWTSLQFFSGNLRQTGFPIGLRFLEPKLDDENTRRKLLPKPEPSGEEV